ncbi:hypothetical protein M8J77_003597 [Diaphorina citri]|nr:hypothetical protein M8J77_003597 [Diaphorina citri]
MENGNSWRVIVSEESDSDIRSGIMNNTPDQPSPSLDNSSALPFNPKVFMETVVAVQNRTLEGVLLKISERIPATSSKETGFVRLLEFQPGSDARTWLETVDFCLGDRPRKGSDFLLSLARALKGAAAGWFSDFAHTEMTWEDFKTAFIQEYDVMETPPTVINNIIRSSPQGQGNYVELINQMYRMLNARCKGMTVSEMSVTLIIAHLSRFDERISRLARTQNIQTKEELVKEMGSFSYGKRHNDGLENIGQTEAKRFSNSQQQLTANAPRITCHYCRRPGHRMTDCRVKKYEESTNLHRHDIGRRTNFGDKPSVNEEKPRFGLWFSVISQAVVQRYNSSCGSATVIRVVSRDD